MTAWEAKRQADGVNLIKNDTIYKELQKSIQNKASKGGYTTIVSFPACLLEKIDNGLSYCLSIKERLDNAVSSLRKDGFEVVIKDSDYIGCKYDVIINWTEEKHK